jgi:hypothetical protein
MSGMGIYSDASPRVKGDFEHFGLMLGERA